MSNRLNYVYHSREMAKKLDELNKLLQASTLGSGLTHLVHLRASQINGCAFCVDMHTKQAKLHGERELRLHHLIVWRESPLFSERERIALEWTEAVTKISQHNVTDDLYQRALTQFSEQELSELTFSIGLINIWNRLAISFQSVPGSLDHLYGLDKAGL